MGVEGGRRSDDEVMKDSTEEDVEGRHASTDVSLWSMASWQSETLQPSESAGGKMVGLQRGKDLQRDEP